MQTNEGFDRLVVLVPCRVLGVTGRCCSDPAGLGFSELRSLAGIAL